LLIVVGVIIYMANRIMMRHLFPYLNHSK